MNARGVWLKVRALLTPRRVERELDDELRFHLEMETEQNLRRGMRPREARREAYRRFGGVERFKEQTREVRGTRWADDLVRDTRQGFRALVRSRGFAAAALLTIALGVGATTTVFSVVRGVLLRPLPYAEPQRFVSVWLSNPPQGIEEDITSYPVFEIWREQGTTLEHVVGVRDTRTTLTGGGEPEEVLGAAVTRGFFDMLGVQPALGRGFRPEESESDVSSRVVVLSHELWTRRYGADPTLIGRTIPLDDVPHEVVGVSAPGAAFPPHVQLWTPLSFEGNEDLREAPGALWLPVVGRLAEGVELEEAQGQMSGVAARVAELYPDTYQGTGVELEPMHQTLVGDVRTPLMILLGAVVLVLLIAAANVANLLLARGTVRGREMAVRLALGAGRGRLARQVLAESTLLGVVGGVLGTVLAAAGVRVLLRLAPADLPRLDGVAVDLPVLGFALLVALGTSVLFGVVPALRASAETVSDDLRAGGRGASDGALRRLRAAFVAAQFALALVLLVGSGLLVRSFVNLQSVDPGLDPRSVLSFHVGLPGGRYETYEDVRAFYDELLSGLAALPGAERAAAVSGVFKVQLANMAGITIESRPELEGRENPVAYDGATPDFLEVLGMELTAGRGFTEQDERRSTRVAIVSETFVRTFLADRDPLGERFVFGDGPPEDESRWLTIVGVVADAQRWGVGEPLRPYAFMPMTQYMDTRADILVRASGDPTALAQGVRDVVGRVDPSLAITNLRTLEQTISGSLAQRRFLMFLLAVFAGSATVLAGVGIYGVMAYLVSRRTREIGIRVAMGARRWAVVRSVLQDALLQATAGVLLGLAGAFALTRFLRSQLFGLEPTDPLTFMGVVLLLVGVALLASFVPAKRAAGVQPSVALREE
jgi:putative ABC transport system permease protein